VRIHIRLWLILDSMGMGPEIHVHIYIYIYMCILRTVEPWILIYKYQSLLLYRYAGVSENFNFYVTLQHYHMLV
jgi:hypothetical protein